VLDQNSVKHWPLGWGYKSRGQSPVKLAAKTKQKAGTKVMISALGHTVSAWGLHPALTGTGYLRCYLVDKCPTNALAADTWASVSAGVDESGIPWL